MKALSIRQPYAWLIVQGHKDVENRTWPTRYRGPILIHASQALYPDYDGILRRVREQFGIEIPPGDQVERGGVIGRAEIVDCVTQSQSPWFWGPYGFVLRNAAPLPFQPLRGHLGLFEVPGSA
jgi:hypothetical protein